MTSFERILVTLRNKLAKQEDGEKTYSYIASALP